jgi:hypothetical protein
MLLSRKKTESVNDDEEKPHFDSYISQIAGLDWLNHEELHLAADYGLTWLDDAGAAN